MTLRLSTGARNRLLQSDGFAAIFNRGSIDVYSGAQPVNADAAVTGTLLGTITASSLALTPETQASQTVTLSGTLSGSVNTVTVGTVNIIPDGAVAFNVSLDQTASDLADAINRNGIYSATVLAAVVTLKPRFGTGAAHNAYVVAATATGVTATSGGNMAGGVSPVNGLFMGKPALGVVGKPAAQAWSFNGVAAGVAGWFRFKASAVDAGVLSALLPRLDGSVATSGGDMALNNITVAVGAPNTVDRFNMTMPSQ